MGTQNTAVLFMCVANSARSQMAEGFARAAAPPDMAVYSAGSAPTSLNPYAVRVMKEVGIDIAGHRAKSIDEVPCTDIGTVVTLCAEEGCPVFPGDVCRLHWPFEDPAAVVGSEAECLEAFRRVRDDIRGSVEQFFGQRARDETSGS